MKLHVGEIVVTKDWQYEWIFDGYMRVWISGRDCFVKHLSQSNGTGGAFYSHYLIPKYRRFVLIEKYKQK